MISEKIKNNGELHKGYIVGMKIIYSTIGYFDLYLNVFFDGNVHIVIDNSFIDYYEIISKRHRLENTNVFVKGIPVDVYTKKGSIYLDLDSISIEEV